MFTYVFKLVMHDGHYRDAGRQCLESPPGLVQCVCAPSCPDHWKPVNTSNIYIVIMTNYPSRCVEVMVCPTTTTAFFIEPLVLKRSTYLPSMMASAGVAKEKKWTHKRDLWIWISKHVEILFLQTRNIVKIKKTLGNTPGAMELLNIFQHKREK